MKLQSAIHSAGPQAASIEGLWWVFFSVAVVVYVSVVTVLLLALARRRQGAEPAGAERRVLRGVALAVGVTVVTLFGLLTSSIIVGRGIAELRHGEVTIKITGHRWWWQVEYDHEDASKRISTANEIYLPVGVPVRVELRTADVIHSFWVPNLHGKQDLINGVPGVIFLQADRPGTCR